MEYLRNEQWDIMFNFKDSFFYILMFDIFGITKLKTHEKVSILCRGNSGSSYYL